MRGAGTRAHARAGEGRAFDHEALEDVAAPPVVHVAGDLHAAVEPKVVALAEGIEPVIAQPRAERLGRLVFHRGPHPPVIEILRDAARAGGAALREAEPNDVTDSERLAAVQVLALQRSLARPALVAGKVRIDGPCHAEHLACRQVVQRQHVDEPHQAGRRLANLLRREQGVARPLRRQELARRSRRSLGTAARAATGEGEAFQRQGAVQGDRGEARRFEEHGDVVVREGRGRARRRLVRACQRLPATEDGGTHRDGRGLQRQDREAPGGPPQRIEGI